MTTLTVTMSRRDRFKKSAKWKEVATRKNVQIVVEPVLEQMQDLFGMEVGGFCSADGSTQGWEFVGQDPNNSGQSLLTVIEIRRD